MSGMRRREFITLLGGAAAAWPLAARAQQPSECGASASSCRRSRTIRRPGPHRGVPAGAAAIGLDRRPQRADRLSLGRRQCDDIREIRGGTGRARAGRHSGLWRPRAWRRCCRRPAPCRSCSSIGVDPVGAGFVDSLARPGGNATGFTDFEYGMSGEMAGAAQEIAPGVTRVAVLRDPANPAGHGQFGAIQAVAPSFGVEVSPVNMRDAVEIERAVAAFARASNGGLIVTASASAVVHRDLIITLAARHKLPAVYFERSFVAAGGLISYGPDHRRPVPARGRLRRSHPQGREARRPAGAGADQVSSW